MLTFLNNSFFLGICSDNVTVLAYNQVRSKNSNLLNHEIIVEKLSGDVLDVEVSALKKTNLDKLEEAINLIINLSSSIDNTSKDLNLIDDRLYELRSIARRLDISPNEIIVKFFVLPILIILHLS